MKTISDYFLLTFAGVLLLSNCHKPKPVVASGTKSPGSELPDTASNVTQELAVLRSELSKNSGSDAYSKLHHSGKEGYGMILEALASGEITPDHYFSWSYDLETRWPDGDKLSDDFDTYMLNRARKDDGLAKKLGKFFSPFPQDFLAELRKKGPGGLKIAQFASKSYKPKQ